MDSYVLRNRLRFVGTGSDLFGIYIINLLLTLVTLGFYYPWAKAAMLKYTYANTLLDDQPFQFHGTGREMFMGYIRLVGVLVVLGGTYFGLQQLSVGTRFFGTIALGLVVLGLTPFAIHGSLRYRTSRSSWQGIHFGYRGERDELIKKYFGQGLLTVITFGIYQYWMRQNLYRYTLGNVRFGSAQVKYTGEGDSYFGVDFGGRILTGITFGIYGFWWGRNLFDYFVDNLEIEQDEKSYNFQSTMTVETYFSMVVINFLLTFFTLGLAKPWATVRRLNMMTDNIMLDERFNTNALTQTEAEFKNATGEDMADILNLDLI